MTAAYGSGTTSVAAQGAATLTAPGSLYTLKAFPPPHDVREQIGVFTV